MTNQRGFIQYKGSELHAYALAAAVAKITPGTKLSERDIYNQLYKEAYEDILESNKEEKEWVVMQAENAMHRALPLGTEIL